MTPIEPNSRWLFVGSDSSPTMLRHTVLMADELEVVTWSECIPESSIFNAGVCGYSWLGTPESFLRQFKPSIK